MCGGERDVSDRINLVPSSWDRCLRKQTLTRIRTCTQSRVLPRACTLQCRSSAEPLYLLTNNNSVRWSLYAHMWVILSPEAERNSLYWLLSSLPFLRLPEARFLVHVGVTQRSHGWHITASGIIDSLPFWKWERTRFRSPNNFSLWG